MLKEKVHLLCRWLRRMHMKTKSSTMFSKFLETQNELSDNQVLRERVLEIFLPLPLGLSCQCPRGLCLGIQGLWSLSLLFTLWTSLTFDSLEPLLFTYVKCSPWRPHTPSGLFLPSAPRLLLSLGSPQNSRIAESQNAAHTHPHYTNTHVCTHALQTNLYCVSKVTLSRLHGDGSPLQHT